MVQWLTTIGIAAEEVDETAFRAVEAEKLIWNCAFGLLCERYDTPVDRVVTEHGQVLGQLVSELLQVAHDALGVELALDPLVERLAAYSMSLAGYQGAVKEWRWRNGWFVEAARTHGTSTPTHDALLVAIGR
jgi:ketopantoate reductase